MLAVLCVSLAGCGGKFSKEKFDKVETGMAEQKVTDLLGSPEKSSEMGGVKSLVWKSGDTYYNVTLKDGKVLAKGTLSAKDFEAMGGK
jgi:hypothetical protein